MIKEKQKILQQYLKWGWLAFIVITVVFTLLTIQLQRQQPQLVRQLLIEIRQILPPSRNSVQLFGAILLNNEKVALMILFLALIPIPGIYWLTFLATSSSVGLVLGLTVKNGSWFLAVKAFVLGILPHGIIEMSALLIAVALAAQLNQQWRRFLFSKKHNHDNTSLKSILLQYVILVVPLIAVAAVIESFITPVLIKWGGF